MTNALRSGSVNRNARRTLARAAAVAAALAVVVTASVVGTPGDGGVAAAGDPLGAGGEFHSLTPARLLDTRDPKLDVAPKGRKPTDSLSVGKPFEVSVVGAGGLPDFVDDDRDGYDDNVLAVVLNITVIEPTQLGYLRAFPAGAEEGTTSVVNFQTNSTVPNTAVIRPGIDGKIALRLVTPLAPGQADVAVDISGWISTSRYAQRGRDSGRFHRFACSTPTSLSSEPRRSERARRPGCPSGGPSTPRARASRFPMTRTSSAPS